MMKSLLVAYDGSHGARVALQHAVDLARRSEGRITLMTVSRTPTDERAAVAESGVDPVALAAEGAREGEEDALAPDADGVLSDAVEVCRELTVRCLARPAYGDLPTALARASGFCDLIFIGRDAAAEPGVPGLSARSARRVAMAARCPVIVTPRQYQPVRSVVSVCLSGGTSACTLRAGSALAGLLQVKLDALLIAGEQDAAAHATRELKRYLVDHGHGAAVAVRKPPVRDALLAAIGDRQSPLVVVPRAGRWDALMRRDGLSAALEVLGATIVVTP
ncbi:MAG: universal stress protein [Armatimonadetes bacterium]|nr:universal stress protein [Armatimonadota bacterium]